jgi:hypothetical protein
LEKEKCLEDQVRYPGVKRNHVEGSITKIKYPAQVTEIFCIQRIGGHFETLQIISMKMRIIRYTDSMLTYPKCYFSEGFVAATIVPYPLYPQTNIIEVHVWRQFGIKVCLLWFQ